MEALGARARLAEGDELAGVALVAAWAVAVSRGVLVEGGLPRVADHEGFVVMPTTGARERVPEDLVDGLFPVDLHFSETSPQWTDRS